MGTLCKALGRLSVRAFTTDSEKAGHLADFTRYVFHKSMDCCGTGCVDCVWLASEDEVVRSCQGLDVDTCIKLLDENVANRVAFEILKDRLTEQNTSKGN
ncbi:hypothetical protein TTRE_0000110801 [Trichuris trichiura]|uniref:Uncharacterized protein n=1 Tax=Trichuris trichiura TaxID=36087 RepID=A0A077YYG7_TRITR|nr:hypothetical protein TTRE_0000110801 [Trichuris trichiura]